MTLDSEAFERLMEWFTSIAPGTVFTKQQRDLIYEYYKYLSYGQAQATLKNIVMNHTKRGYQPADLYLPIKDVIAQKGGSELAKERDLRHQAGRLCLYCDSLGVLECLDTKSPKKSIWAFACTFCNIAKDYRKLRSYSYFERSVHEPRGLIPIQYSNVEHMKRLFQLRKNPNG